MHFFLSAPFVCLRWLPLPKGIKSWKKSHKPVSLLPAIKYISKCRFCSIFTRVSLGRKISFPVSMHRAMWKLIWNGSGAEAERAQKAAFIITGLACAGVTFAFAFPHKHPTFPHLLPIDAGRLLRRAPQHYLAAERKRLMPNACCGRLIPRSAATKKEADARCLHFCCLLFPLGVCAATFREVRNASRALAAAMTLIMLSRAHVSELFCARRTDDWVRVCVRWLRCRRCCNEIRRRTHTLDWCIKIQWLPWLRPQVRHGESFLHGIINILL